MTKSLILCIYSILVLACCTANSNSKSIKDIQSPPTSFVLGEKGDTCTVYKVVDGDTFWGETSDGRKIKVRFIGVDAPETRNTAKKPSSPYGKVSKQYLYDLIMEKRVILKYDVDKTDRWGRALAYVYLEDGRFVNAELVKSGNAVVMTVPPNVKYVEQFIKLQRQARDKGRGMWSPDIAYPEQ